MKPLVVFFIALAVGGTAFYGGIQYQKSQGFAGRNFMMGQQQGTGRTGGINSTRRVGSGVTFGDILSMDSTSLTIKLPDGSSRIVLFSDKTTYNKTAPVEKSELKVGEKVNVFGTPNADGSVTAQSIQLNPQQVRMGGIGGTMPSASGAAR
jgi:hypothetical protein